MTELLIVTLGAALLVGAWSVWDTWRPSLRIITRENNELYLKRWALRSQTPGDTPWRIFLHRFYSHDEDGHHNHPWVFCFSIVLWGSYTEEYFDVPDGHHGCFHPDANGAGVCAAYTERKTRRVRWFNWIPRSRYHRITALHGTVWTLFFAGPRHVDDWGFYFPHRGHIPWRDRLRERGLDPQ